MTTRLDLQRKRQDSTMAMNRATLTLAIFGLALGASFAAEIRQGRLGASWLLIWFDIKRPTALSARLGGLVLADDVHEILKGAKPGDIPIYHATIASCQAEIHPVRFADAAYPLLHASPHRVGLGAGRGGWVRALKFVVVDRRDNPLSFGTRELSKRTAFKLHVDGFVCFVHCVAAVHRDDALRDGLVLVGRAAHPIVDLRKVSVEQHLCEPAIGAEHVGSLWIGAPWIGLGAVGVCVDRLDQCPRSDDLVF
jgi:hypothetical protein